MIKNPDQQHIFLKSVFNIISFPTEKQKYEKSTLHTEAYWWTLRFPSSGNCTPAIPSSWGNSTSLRPKTGQALITFQRCHKHTNAVGLQLSLFKVMGSVTAAAAAPDLKGITVLANTSSRPPISHWTYWGVGCARSCWNGVPVGTTGWVVQQRQRKRQCRGR